MKEQKIDRMYQKISWRLLPFLLLCYFFAYLDRINIGFAKLQMQQDLGFSDAIYGMAAGIFFLGYVIFEVPTNLYFNKVGARKTFMRIMVLWGITSMSMLFVTTPTMFYVLRFLLGVFEAGFAPGLIFYLTYWYSGARMARVMAIVMLAAPLGGMLGAPLSTQIMTHMHNIYHMAGWQWLFLLEGFPTVLLGIMAYFYLVDHPQDAKWLSQDEKKLLQEEIQHHQAQQTHKGFKSVLKDPWIYFMALGYFSIISGIYAVGFWLPSLLKTSGIQSLTMIGWLVAIPYLLSAIMMNIFARRSDRYQERKWHSILPTLFAGVCLSVSVISGNFILSFIAICFATGFMFVGYTIFWSIPSQYLSGTAAAGGIALINSIGLMGGFVSPNIMAFAQSSTHSLVAGWIAIAVLLGFGSLLLWYAFHLKKACHPLNTLRATS
ncbi:MFS transporter [uncultured Acinetobacter sp.]|uniref:MFS transporter n=1 Tax=uncultured Acinetobacter sp. TaxID=165433 RepID=UPI0026354ABA|nr:MFS transporter [uncultured Acinetobacter sp.]